MSYTGWILENMLRSDVLKYDLTCPNGTYCEKYDSTCQRVLYQDIPE